MLVLVVRIQTCADTAAERGVQQTRHTLQTARQDAMGGDQSDAMASKCSAVRPARYSLKFGAPLFAQPSVV